MGGEVRRTSHDARFVSVCFGRGEVSDPAEPNGNVSRRREASAVYTLVYTNASSFELSEHVRYETRTNETLVEYRTRICFENLLKGWWAGKKFEQRRRRFDFWGRVYSASTRFRSKSNLALSRTNFAFRAPLKGKAAIRFYYSISNRYAAPVKQAVRTLASSWLVLENIMS